MKSFVIEVGPEDDGRTLQAVLHDRAAISHSEARGLIDAGAVHGRTRIKPGDYVHRVAAGERYEVRRDEERRYRPRPGRHPSQGFRVLHEDRHLLVVSKAAGLLSVPTDLRPDEDSLMARLLERERERGVRVPALFALHRLDRDTSGLLIVVRGRRAFEGLQEQLDRRTIDRRYIAVVRGTMAADSGRLISHLVEDPQDLKVRSTKRAGLGREAITEYEVTERLPAATVLAIRLLTGRKNQIRVQMAEAGHPLMGDRRYGSPSPFIDRTALHARSLGFVHPVTGRSLSFSQPPPRDMQRLIRALRNDSAVC